MSTDALPETNDEIASHYAREKQRRKSLSLAAFCIAAASLITLFVGIGAPAFTVVPSVGDRVADAYLIDVFPEYMKPQQYSLVSAVKTLLKHGEVALGLIIFTSSILFPIIKLTVTIALTFLSEPTNTARQRKLSSNARAFLALFGSWSMLDVFIVSVIVVGFKEFPGGTRIVREYGLLWFGASILLAITSASILHTRDHHGTTIS